MSLRELIGAVEAGSRGDDFWSAVQAIPPMHITAVTQARDGSLDAAKALHDALLPGWRVANIGQRYGAHEDPPDAWRVWLVAPDYLDTCAQKMAVAITPARAWLLAILRAMEAEGRE